MNSETLISEGDSVQLFTLFSNSVLPRTLRDGNRSHAPTTLRSIPAIQPATRHPDLKDNCLSPTMR
jgi:hypothetical protein